MGESARRLIGRGAETIGRRVRALAGGGAVGATSVALLVSVLVVVAGPASAAGPQTPTARTAQAAPAGIVSAWGQNPYGELGDGTTTDTYHPTAVSLPAGTTVTAVATGAFHSLALTSTGSVLSWGSDGYGQLGNGTDDADAHVPVAVSMPAGVTVTAIAAGGYHNLALTSTGSVLAWGNNGYGQLGNGTNSESNVPVAVSLPAGTIVTAIAAGDGHSLALTSTGSVLAWGLNDYGELGNGTYTNSNTPVAVSLPAGTTVTAIDADGTGDHNLALTSTGSVLAWGYNIYGQLGDGVNNTASNTPTGVLLPAGTTVTAVAAGTFHSLALTTTGLLAWGADFSGEIGNGIRGDYNTPTGVLLPAGTTVTAIAAGDSESLALTTAGTPTGLLAWGANTGSQLGGSQFDESSTPIRVSLPAGTTVTAIAAGHDDSLVVTPLMAPAFRADSPPTTAAVAAAYPSYKFTASGTPTPTFTVHSGNLPAGLSLDAVTGVLSGTPTTAGPSTFTVAAANGVNPDAVSGPITITAKPGDPIAVHYQMLGGPSSYLGAPTKPEQPIGAGRIRTYQHGAIYWSPSTGAHAVHGAILDHYLTLGGPTAFLGFPTSDEQPTTAVGGRFNSFKSGVIYWSPATGAFSVHGAILYRYRSLGGAASFLGFPTSDEYQYVATGRRSNFQHGTITYNSATGTTTVT